MWREVFGRGVVRVEIEPLSNDLPFCAEATLRALPGLRTIACNGSDVCFERTRAMTAEGDDSIGLVVNLGRMATASQGGRDVTLGAGDAVPIFTREPAILAGMRHVGILVPRSAIAARVRDIDGVAMRLIPRETESLRLLASYMNWLSENLVLASPKLRRILVSHVHDLVALALSPGPATRTDGLGGVAAAHLRSILDCIAGTYSEPGLTVAKVARKQLLSPRYLQRLLETTGTSFTARVTELRLQKALTLLTGDHGKRRISEVALQAGFSDISHFNRLFRARFGDTPSGMRRQHRREQ